MGGELALPPAPLPPPPPALCFNQISNSSGLQLSFTSPVYSVDGICKPTIQPPAIVLPLCSSFGLRLTNLLPFQQFDTCPALPTLANVANGPHNLDWTNMHTHGLKV